MIHLRLVILLSALFHCAKSENRRREYTINVGYAQNSSSIVVINNQFPGPMFEADINDTLIIHVHNNLPNFEELTMHFHGQFQRLTPEMDGVAYVTQMPIPSGEQFTYVFRAYPAGTYFYHSHSGLQAVTAFGPLIIHDPSQDPDIPEVPSGPLLFSDQWLTSNRLVQEQGLLGSPFTWEGEPTGLLINGKRDFRMRLKPNSQYLLRLIGATSLSTIVFGINDHPMTVIQVDGMEVQPKPNLTSIEIASGQRYVVIIRTKNQKKGVFLMQASIRWRSQPVNSSCTGVLYYGSASQIPSDLSTVPAPSLANETDLLAAALNSPYENKRGLDVMPTRTPHREHYFLAAQERTPVGAGIRWVINNASLDMQRLENLTTPLLFDLYNGNEENVPNDVTYTINYNELVDIVLQNTVALNGVCESHPFHLHGHKFWVHSYGSGMYNNSAPDMPLSSSPVFRDTAILYAAEYAYFTPDRNSSNYGQPCGWMKLRMIADNPGMWMFHCHIGAHAFMGMNVLFAEAINRLTMDYIPQN